MVSIDLTRPYPPRPDIAGRWWNLPEAELCNACGQPDNCGDCNHELLSDSDYLELNPTQEDAD